MTNKTSRVLFECDKYVVCYTRAGLSVQNKWCEDGKILTVGTKECEEWLEAFENAVDECEAFDLAGALYNR